MNRKLDLTAKERAKFEANNELWSDSRGDECFVGLDCHESNRYLKHLREESIE